MDASNIAIGIGIGMGVAALGVGIGQGLAANAGLSAMGRQPEAAGRIQTGMLIALAFIELVFLLTFVVMFLLAGKVPGLTAAPAVTAGSGARASIERPNEAPVARLR